jgi:hypothetical protein
LAKLWFISQTTTTTTTIQPKEKLLRLAARLKWGYYPLPSEHGPRIRARLVFPESTIYALDPGGTGAALKAITDKANATLYGVELDADRAEAAGAAGLKMIQGNAFDVRARVERLSLLYLNPPYDFEVGPLANKRMERLFLAHTYLTREGVKARIRTKWIHKWIEE